MTTATVIKTQVSSYSETSHIFSIFTKFFSLLLIIDYSGFSKRTAPPTDDELFKQGLGSKLLPPPAQSPDRNGSPILPPNDVQLAIAMSRANMKQHQPPSSGEKVGLPPLHPSNSSSSLHPPSLLSRASSMEHEESAPSTPTVPGTSSNTYSIGRMPPGVSWRYVNILDENTTK